MTLTRTPYLSVTCPKISLPAIPTIEYNDTIIDENTGPCWIVIEGENCPNPPLLTSPIINDPPIKAIKKSFVFESLTDNDTLPSFTFSPELVFELASSAPKACKPMSYGID